MGNKTSEFVAKIQKLADEIRNLDEMVRNSISFSREYFYIVHQIKQMNDSLEAISKILTQSKNVHAVNQKYDNYEIHNTSEPLHVMLIEGPRGNHSQNPYGQNTKT